MLRDEGVVVESTWSVMDAVARCGWAMPARETGGANERARETEAVDDRDATDYREIDRQLRRIAKRKAGLEIEEAQWLREAEKQRIWRNLGYSTALEYLEDVFGYAPRTAMERLRVAKELGALPSLEAAVREGELPYSAARELTRVMTPETEGAWLASARGRSLRDIEELVAGRKKGDKPDAEKNPELVKRRRVLELSLRVDALIEQCRAVLANELGGHVDDEVLTEMLCRCFLAGGAIEGGTGETNASAESGKTNKMKAPRPVHRIVIYKCESCTRGLQQGRGRTVELTADELALAECDGETVHLHDEGYLPSAPSQSDQLASRQSDDLAVPPSMQVGSSQSEQLASPQSDELIATPSMQLGTSQSQQLAAQRDEQRAAPSDEQLAALPRDDQAPRESSRTLEHVAGKQRSAKSTRRLARNAAKTLGCHTAKQCSLQSKQPSMLEASQSGARLADIPATPQIEPRSMPRLQQRITADLSQRAKPNIPQRIRNLVWARDRGRCRVPGCRATRCLDIHHIRRRSEGGDHHPANLLVLCSGHHKLHHAGLLSISGRAPDQLVFMRDGKVLVDARSPGQTNASEVLRRQTATSRFADVTRREHAKQALMQFGYKARAAGAAIDEVIAHVDSEADVGTIVKAALARGAAPKPADAEDPVALARRALVQAGFSLAIATQAVERATAHVGTPVELAGLIKEALRWCR